MREKIKAIGEAIDRVDGFLKVTGSARYASDQPVTNPAHGFVLKSTIASGRIVNIDQAAAEKTPGVITVITHKNAPRLTPSGNLKGSSILQDPNIEFFGQHIAVVVAETYEQARFASRLIKVEYEKTEA